MSATAGWAVKEPDSRDRRIRRVSLSDQGRQLIGGFFPDHMTTLGRAFSALSDTEKDRLTALLKKLGKSLQED